jgi:hypothetical protein
MSKVILIIVVSLMLQSCLTFKVDSDGVYAGVTWRGAKQVAGKVLPQVLEDKAEDYVEDTYIEGK